MVWLCLLAVAVATPGFGQSAKKSTPRKAPAAKTASKPPSSNVPDKWPIATITVEGNQNYTAADVVRASGLKPGQTAGKADFDAARDRLVATGVFETVGYKFGTAPGTNAYAAVFQVVEVEPHYPVRFERLDVPVNELKAFLKQRDPFFGDKIPPTQAILDRHARGVEEFLSARNRKEGVTAKVVADKPNEFAVVFSPAKREPAVGEVRFEGNRLFTNSALLNQFSGVAYGAPFRDDGFRQLLDASIRPMYEARGRLRVKFPTIRTEPMKGVDGIRAIVTVEEGESYDLGEVGIDGDSPVPAKDLLKAGKFKLGEVANFQEINEGVALMKKRLRREGYMNAAITLERKLNDEKKILDLIAVVEPGNRFTQGKLTLVGLDLNGEAAIKKLWKPQVGEPFNADYPDFFLAQIREQGLFDDLGKTKAELDINEGTRTVNVTLVFGAASTESGEAGQARQGRRRR